MTNIGSLKDELRQIGFLNSTSMILRWDQQTYMPDGAAEFRSKQKSLIDQMIHRRMTGKEFEEILGGYVDLDNGEVLADDLSRRSRRALEEAYRDYDQARSLPTEFVGKMSEAGSKSVQAWHEAKEKDEFAIFLPHLEEMVEINKQKAEYLGYEDKPLDALIDYFEPGMTTERLKGIFAPVRDRLTELTDRIVASVDPVDGEFLRGDFPLDAQYDFTCEVLESMGYDFDRGRQDKSAHPFTMGLHPTDTRVTNRFDRERVAMAIGSAVHEGGHGLYEQGLDPDEFGNPLGQSISFGIHESQSRLWENMVGASREFWSFWLPRLKEYFPGQLDDVDLDEWYEAYNRVEPSLIRVESDEVHYNLHILLRFELEDALINEGAEPSRVPDLWDEKMEKYIGITPDSDARGALQDIHWSWGQFGYFPSYSLGTFYSVQIFERAKEEIPGLTELIAQGDLIPIKEWLNENVHRYGREFKAAELVEEITGEGPSAEPFLDYLEEKYSKIYEV